MGNVHAYRGRLMPALFIAAFAVLVVVALLALTAGPAAAIGDYVHGGASCGSCHTSLPYSAANVSNAQCQTCHTGGFDAHPKSGVASTCWTCHTPGQDMTTIQTAAGCGAAAAGAGCHGAAGHVGSTPTTCTKCHTPSTGPTAPGQSAHHKAAVTDVTVKALLTIKVPASVGVNKNMKATGLAKSYLAGYKVKVAIQRKVGTKWVKVTTKTAVWTQASSSWTMTFKPTKKGSWRMMATTPAVVGTNGNAKAIAAGKTAFKTFKVK